MLEIAIIVHFVAKRHESLDLYTAWSVEPKKIDNYDVEQYDKKEEAILEWINNTIKTPLQQLFYTHHSNEGKWMVLIYTSKHIKITLQIGPDREGQEAVASRRMCHLFFCALTFKTYKTRLWLYDT